MSFSPFSHDQRADKSPCQANTTLWISVRSEAQVSTLHHDHGGHCSSYWCACSPVDFQKGISSSSSCCLYLKPINPRRGTMSRIQPRKLLSSKAWPNARRTISAAGEGWVGVKLNCVASTGHQWVRKVDHKQDSGL